MVQCIHGSPLHFAPNDVVGSLPESQGTIARHRCVICSYVAGINVSRGAPYVEEFSTCRHGSIAPVTMIEALPIYQGSAGRHKCVHCAYNAGMRASSLEDVTEAYQHICKDVGATEALAETKVRIGQNIFRANLMDLWGARCAATGIEDTRLLRASHIIPWAKCESDAMRLDKHNGVLLSPLWDAAFDGGLVSFSDQGVPILSSKLSSRAKILLETSFVKPILFEQSTLPFLEWHRNHEFCS